MAAILCVAGCSYPYDIVVRGMIRDAATGEPISAVRVEIREGETGYDRLRDVSTDASGRFTSKFRSSQPSDDFVMHLAANGYETERIAIGPVERPHETKPLYLIFHVTMRKTVPATKVSTESTLAPANP